MRSRTISRTLLAAALVVGFVCVWQLQARIDSERSLVHLQKEELTLSSSRVVKILSLEYAPLMGAIYWTRAVQYYGNKHRLHDENLEMLWPLLDITTTLDPNLLIAYRFGATFLSDAPPRGAGQPDKAVELLERGLKANPEYWRFYQDLGNVYYFDKKDYPRASQAFEAGSKYPGTPPWMKIMAAKIAAEGESLETSYALWQDIYQTTSDKDIRKNAEDHLRLVRAEMALRRIGQLMSEYEQKTGQRATRINDLVQSGLLAGVPRDPAGFPYTIGEEGKPELNSKSPLQEEWLKEKKQ
jgi:tetratricopeptide (TPR) repeat protein